MTKLENVHLKVIAYADFFEKVEEMFTKLKKVYRFWWCGYVFRTKDIIKCVSKKPEFVKKRMNLLYDDTAIYFVVYKKDRMRDIYKSYPDVNTNRAIRALARKLEKINSEDAEDL